MAAHPSLELDDGARPVAATRQLEDVILHRFTRRAPAVSTRPQFGDRVLTRVLLAPEAIGFCITSVIRRRRYRRCLDLGTRDGVSNWPGARRGGDDRHGADVDEGGDRGRGERDDGKYEPERVPHGSADLDRKSTRL